MTTDNVIRIGTRGSDLALAQAELVKSALEKAWPGLVTRIEVIKTTGDQRLDLSFSRIGGSDASGEKVDKGLFTKELEQSLHDGRIDLAVHSLKDLPTDPVSGLILSAVLPRDDVRDVLVTRQPMQLGEMPSHGALATSSLRRRLQLLRHRPALRVVEMRGNVPTRLRKLAANSFLDGIVLACAGLRRLGFHPEKGRLSGGFGELHALVLEEDQMLPAAGQGAIALQTREGDQRVGDLVKAVNDHETMVRVTAERAFLNGLGGGCRSPVGVSTSLNDGGGLTLRAVVFEGENPDSARQAEFSGPDQDPEGVAGALLKKFL